MYLNNYYWIANIKTGIFVEGNRYNLYTFPYLLLAYTY